MKYLKPFNESNDNELSMFMHLWDDIDDEDDYTVDCSYNKTFKSYTAVIRCDRHRFNKDDGFTIRDIGEKLRLPFGYSKEIGLRIDIIFARDTSGDYYEVEECVGSYRTLSKCIAYNEDIIEFLEEWESDYIKDDKIIELELIFSTLPQWCNDFRTT